MYQRTVSPLNTSWEATMSFTFFTSESVCAGHPDKIADQISDAVLDAALQGDPQSRVAVETLVTKDKIILAGELTTRAQIDLEKLARAQVKRLGYTEPEWGFHDQSPVSVLVHQQSPEISVGVDSDGAGDQGMMFGFACNETSELMPMPITLAHALAAKIDAVRESKKLPYLRPDGKTQVTLCYEKGKPVEVETVVVAVPHRESETREQVHDDIFTKVVAPVLAQHHFALQKSQLVVNGTGVWHVGGPAADTGLTGRKIVVDGYGGYARVGGGCFSGKDPTKVDRSGAYAARFIAKNIVAQGLADKAEVALAYCIGHAQPVMKTCETFGSEKVSGKAIASFIDNILDTSVKGIIEAFNLRRPLYLQTAAYGHLGKKGLPWERVVATS